MDKVCTPKQLRGVTVEVSLDFKRLNPRIDGPRVSFEVPYDPALEDLLSNVPDKELRGKLLDCAYEHNVLKVVGGCII